MRNVLKFTRIALIFVVYHGWVIGYLAQFDKAGQYLHLCLRESAVLQAFQQFVAIF